MSQNNTTEVFSFNHMINQIMWIIQDNILAISDKVNALFSLHSINLVPWTLCIFNSTSLLWSGMWATFVGSHSEQDKDNELISTLELDSTVIQQTILASALLYQVTATCNALSSRKFVDTAVSRKRDIIEHHFSGEEETTLGVHAIIYLAFDCVTHWKNCALVI
jgi:hypothetical protein